MAADVEAALFEPGERTPLGAFDDATGQPGLRVAHPLHLLGVAGDVGREVQRAARTESVGQRRDHVRPDETPVVVAAFRPRVGKVDADAGE